MKYTVEPKDLATNKMCFISDFAVLTLSAILKASFNFDTPEVDFSYPEKIQFWLLTTNMWCNLHQGLDFTL